MKTFNGLRGGDVVKFWVPNGTKIQGGKRVVDWAVRKAKVNPLLCFADHVVVNHTSTGTVVDERNYISQVIE